MLPTVLEMFTIVFLPLFEMSGASALAMSAGPTTFVWNASTKRAGSNSSGESYPPGFYPYASARANVGGGIGGTYNTGVVDEVVDALVADDLLRGLDGARDRGGVVYVEREDVQPAARGRSEGLQRVRFCRVAAGGEDDIAGGLEELLRQLQTDSAACPESGVSAMQDSSSSLITYPVINQAISVVDI